MYPLTLNFHGVLLKIICDSPEQVKWLEARHRLFMVPGIVVTPGETCWGEESIVRSLAEHGLFFLHTAAFRNKGGLGILAVGDSGSGKSTIAFSALACGYPYVCDDVALCRRDGHVIRLLPFTNQIGIEGDLTDKIYYDVLEHHQKDVFCEVSPDVVVLPHITPGRVSTLEKVTDERTVVNALVRNISWVNDKVLREQQVHLLRGLSGLPAYTLLLGDDHKQRPQVAIDLLNGI